MPYVFFTCMVLFITICVILVLLVLIKKGRGGGLSGAFGGAGGNTAFGTKTGDVLTWATSVVFGVFLILAVVLNLVADKFGAKAATVTPAAQTTSSTGGSSSSTTQPTGPESTGK
jgi:preprotein translocase subunit SecG